MKSIQQRLQSRVAKRAAIITKMEIYRRQAIFLKDWGEKELRDAYLRNLRRDQKLDKDILSEVYWRL